MTAALVTSSLGIPFCNTLVSLKDVRFVALEGVLGVVFDAGVDFFVGEIAEAFPLDFPVDNARVFVAVPVAAPVAVPIDAETRPVVLGADAPEREICLLTVSLLCLSINGDLAVVAVIVLLSRGLVVPPEVGAVLGLDAPLTPVAGNFEVDVVLAAEVADAGLGFDVMLDADVLTSVVFVVVLVVVGLREALAGFAAGLLTDFASPLIVDFFSIGVPLVFSFDEVVLVFGLIVPELTRGEELVLVAVVVAALVAIVVVFVMVVLPLMLEIAALVDPSSCLGRVAVLVAGFFVVNCVADDVVVVRMVALIALEGEVGVDFVAVFVVDAVVAFDVAVFVGRFALVVVVVFTFIGLVMATAVTVPMTAAPTVASTIPVTSSFDLSIIALSSGAASIIFCGSASSSFIGIFSEAIFSLNDSFVGANSAAFFSVCSCSVCSSINVSVGIFSTNVSILFCNSFFIKVDSCIASDGFSSVLLSGFVLSSFSLLLSSSFLNCSISFGSSVKSQEGLGSLAVSNINFSVL